MWRALVLVVVVACGPSAADIRTAHDANYATDPKHLLQVAMEAANELYGLGDVDLAHFSFVTKSFFSRQRLEHRGWPGEWARGGWRIEVRTMPDGRAYVAITPLAQRSLTVCRRCAPSWVDVPADDVGLAPSLEDGRDKLALAIHDRARQWISRRIEPRQARR